MAYRRLACPAKFRMPDIKRYSGIGCPKIHLRLYSTVMRAHEIDDAQLVDFFPMSLSGTTQRWFALVDISRLCTWEDVANEFLTQFAFSTDIDVSRRELEATRQMPDKFISSLVCVSSAAPISIDHLLVMSVCVSGEHLYRSVIVLSVRVRGHLLVISVCVSETAPISIGHHLISSSSV